MGLLCKLAGVLLGASAVGACKETCFKEKPPKAEPRPMTEEQRKYEQKMEWCARTNCGMAMWRE